MQYQIVEGRVQTRALEYHIVDHCNLNCENCCSFSPILPRWFCDPIQFEKDLRKIKGSLQPQFLKIVGGEPLLHPNLFDLLKIARDVKIAPAVSITTNGHLIQRLPDEAWKHFEMLTVSIYTAPKLSKETLFYIRRKARENGIKVSWKVQDKFVCLDRSEKSSYETAKETYKGCWIHHRCNSVKNGRFYSCTRPQYIQKFAEQPDKFSADGVALNDYNEKDLASALQKHLMSEEPLNSCYLCQGGQAHSEIHRQLDRTEIGAKKELMKGICREI